MPAFNLEEAAVVAPALPRKHLRFPEPFSPRDLRLFRTLGFVLGYALPLLTLKTGYYGTPTELLSRIVPVDFICLGSFGLLCLRGSPTRVPPVAGVYFAAIVISLFPALVLWPGPEDFVWTTFAALLMGFSFYLLGLNIGESRPVTGAVLAGLAWVTLGEFVIVVHDYFSAAQWFPDPMEGRARGTFKANGQLGAFGFCAAGLLIVLGNLAASRRLRNLCLLSGLLAASFVFTASRRTGMICVALWAFAFLVFGVRFFDRPFYKIFLAVLTVGVAAAAISWGALEHTFAGKRLSEGLTTLGSSDGFIQAQHRNILNTASSWFPLGFGPGRGNLIDLRDPEHHEVHNGLLAVLVELGVPGFVGFIGMVLLPLFQGPRSRRSEDQDIRSVLLATFLLISLIFMFHNTLYRDRTFLLFLGMATALVRREKALARAGDTP